MKIKKKWGGGSGQGGGMFGRGGSQDGCQQRIEVFVKIQKKNFFFGVGGQGGGGGGGGGGGWVGDEELKFL